MNYGMELEALEDERRDADMEQASFEAEGRSYSRTMRAMRTALAAGDKERAASLCPHGWGYPLDSIAASDNKDPRAGSDGWRCLNCGSALNGDPFRRRVAVISACELK